MAGSELSSLSNYNNCFESHARRCIESFVDTITMDNRIDINKATRIVKTGTTTISGHLFQHDDPGNGLSLKKVALFYESEFNTIITETNQISKSMLSKLKVVVLCCFCNTTVTISLLYFNRLNKKERRYRCYTCKVSHPLLVKLINGSDNDVVLNEDVDPDKNENDNDNPVHVRTNWKGKKTVHDLNLKKITVPLTRSISEDLSSWEEWNLVRLREGQPTNNTYWKLYRRIQVNNNQYNRKKFQHALSQLRQRGEIIKRGKCYWLRDGKFGKAEYATVPVPQANIDGWIKLYQRCVRVDAVKKQTPPTELPPTKTTKGKEGVDFIHLGDIQSKGTIGFMTIIFGRETMITKSASLLEECANDPIAFREKYFSASDLPDDDGTAAP